MKKSETEKMIYFLHRMSMYVSSVNRENIVSFMYGVDFGKISEPHWTKLLSEFISMEYQIQRKARGWPYQIELLSKQKEIEWHKAFRQVMLEMIIKSNQIPFTKKMQGWVNSMEH